MAKNAENDFTVTIWGARGTLAAAGAQFLHAGGNTNCVEVNCGKHTIVIDAGTGIRDLGSKLMAKPLEDPIDLLLTHAHYDHVEGIPFFAPFFSPERSIRVYCGQLDGSRSTKNTIEKLMRRPYFPVGPEVFLADINYKTVKEKQTFKLSDEVTVSTTPLNHPGGATAYRIDYNGSSFACVTDTENKPGKSDQNILKLIKDIDLFFYDSSLSDEELPEFKGYGHSTYQEGMRLCQKANATAFRAIHHMPFRSDDELDAMEKEIQKELPKSGIGREGDVYRL